MKKSESEGFFAKCQEKIILLFINLMTRCNIGSIPYCAILILECIQVLSFHYNYYGSLSHSTVVSQTISKALAYFRVFYSVYFLVYNIHAFSF